MPYESLLGYALRTSETNGYDTPRKILNYAGINESEMFSQKFAKEKLASLTNKPVQSIERIARVTTDSNGELIYKVINHNLENYHKFYRLKKCAVCPDCIQDSGHLDAFWDLNLSVVCPHHKKPPMMNCNHCGETISWFRPGLNKCRCGEYFENDQAILDEQPILDLMQIFWFKLHNQSLFTLENNCNFPLHAFEHMSLQTFLKVIAYLANLESFEFKDSKKYPYLETVRAASNILANWPHQYKLFLDRFKKVRMKTYGDNVSFYKCFMPIFNMLFRGKLPENEIEFLREEYTYFRLNDWIAKPFEQESNFPQVNNFNKEEIITTILNNDNDASNHKAKIGFIEFRTSNDTFSAENFSENQSSEKQTNLEDEFLETRKAAEFIGLPVNVLTALKKSRHYKIKNIARHYEGYNIGDLNNFQIQLFEKSILVDVNLQNDSSLLNLAYILQKVKFLLKNGKAEFIANYLDGRILSVGKMADEIDKIYFKKQDVYTFADRCKNVVNTKNGKMSYQEASELIGTDMGGILALTDQGLIKKISNSEYMCLCRQSVLNFASLYSGISKIASQNKTSAKRVTKLCNSFSIPILTIPRRERCAVSFIFRCDNDQIEVVIKDNPSRSEKIRRNKLLANDPVSKLNKYLSQLRLKNENLPMLAGKLNFQEIAKVSGFSRNTFYKKPEILKILDEHVFEFNKRNNTTHLPTEKLRNYIEDLKTTSTKPPRNASGTLNKHKIAEICGFDRHLIYKHLEIKEMFDELQHRVY